MPVHPLFLMNDDSSNIRDGDWYMNRVCRTGVLKVPTHSDEGSKQRLMVDVLGISSSDCKSQLARRRETGSSSRATKLWAQLFSEEKEVDNLTLGEMQRSLRKVTGRSIHKESSMEPSRYFNSCDSPEVFRSVDTCTPSFGLELLWEDSTSNSSDNASLGKGISSVSADTAQGQTDEVCTEISKGGDATDLRSGQKRPSADSVTVLDKETAAEDDDWTLQKWQWLLKQGSCRKRPRTLLKSEHESSKSISSNGPALPESDTCDAHHKLTPKVEGSHSESKQGTHPVEVCTISDDTCDTDSSGCDSLHEKDLESHHMSSLKVTAQGNSPQIATSPLSLSAVRLELEDESELTTSAGVLPESLHTSNNKTTWDLKPCSKVQETSIFESASSLTPARTGIQPIIQMPFGKASSLSEIQSNGGCSGFLGKQKQSIRAEYGSDRSCSISSNSEQSRTTAITDGSGVCESKPVTGKVIREIDADPFHNSGFISIPRKSLEGVASLENSVGTESQVQACNHAQQVCGKGVAEVSSALDFNESLDIEEEQELQREPAKIPCKRKAISPMSQEFLLKASKLGNSGLDARSKGQRGWIDVTKLKKGALYTGTATPFGRMSEADGSLQGPACYRKSKDALLEGLQINATSLASPSAPKCVAETVHTTAQQTLAHIRASTSTPPSESQKSTSKFTSLSLTSGTCPSVPAKGILKSASQACQGSCVCEECVSIRSRAERASEFSQRQMQDIEGLAVKLLKDLSILRNIVEDRLIQSPSRHQGPQTCLNLDQLKKATSSALVAEETAKKWLVRMARDCNRYCKIMRMQGRKLTFADESGGKLCHVKVFRTEPVLDPSTVLTGCPPGMGHITSSARNEPAHELGQG